MQVQIYASQLNMINKAIETVLDEVHGAEREHFLTAEIMTSIKKASEINTVVVRVALCREVYGTLTQFDFYVDANTSSLLTREQEKRFGLA